jgi:hypothetical protein
MQKLWSSKNKQSQPLPPEGEDETSPAVESLDQEVPTSSEGDLKYFSKLLKKPFEFPISASWLFLALGLGGVTIVTIIGLQYLTAPEATPDSNLACKSKISGDWQTPFGKVTCKSRVKI